MAREGGNLDATLIAAVGDDPALLRDLRRAFLESADRQIDLVERAADDASWKAALWRLKGLCGSFGVLSMMGLAEAAAEAPAGDPRALRRLRAALEKLARPA